MPRIEFTPEEQQILKAEFGRQLFQSVETSEKLKSFSNEQLGRLLFYHVLNNMDLLSPQADVVREAMDRLGFIVPDDEETTHD